MGADQASGGRTDVTAPTSPEVEVFWPAGLPQSAVSEAGDLLRAAGVETTCRLEPVRRGAELSVLVLVTTSVLQPFLSALFSRVAADAYTGLTAFVRRLLQKDPDAVHAPTSVVFESTATGAQFVFVPGLPEEAFRQALTVQSAGGAGRWTWDPSARRWLLIETRPAAPA